MSISGKQPRPQFTVKALQEEAATFAESAVLQYDASLYGITDGKAVGTHLERRLRDFLSERYSFAMGNPARGLDFPDINVDIKITSIRQPQSSSPFESAKQKVRGLGYSLLVLIYDKRDDHDHRTGTLDILHTIFVDKSRTADYQTTRGIIEIIDREGNSENIVAFMLDRNLPVDQVEAHKLAEELLRTPPILGYLTISNALQWRLQYQRIIEQAGHIDGILRVY